MAKISTDTRNQLPAKDFAEPEKRAYPIEDKGHARNAKARASQAVNAGVCPSPRRPKSTKRPTRSSEKG